MEATVEYVSGVKFEISARGHRMICDQPVEKQGTDAGMTPPEFLLSALGSCAAYYAVEYLRARKFPVEDVRVHVTAEKATGPARLGSFHIEVVTPDLEPRHAEGVARAVKSCLVHNTLMHAPAIDLKVIPVGKHEPVFLP